jgi:aminoglycoside 3-N-acetyltransferase
MRIFLRKILVKVLSKERQKYLKGLEYKSKKGLAKTFPKISEDKFREMLIEQLMIKKGDHLFIHASLDMLHTDLTSLDILRIILDIIGKEGSISVPTFTKYLSKDWMLMKKEFNIRRTPSGMGIFSEMVRRDKDARRSLHPTKSVATIGSIAKSILDEHHLDIYQFGKKSPFYKLLDYDVKIIGLGVSMPLSMVHVVEDVFPTEHPVDVNEKEVLSKTCIDENKNSINVKTLVHDINIIVKGNSKKFVQRYMNKEDYVISKHYSTPFYMVKGKQFFEELESQMRQGITIYN